MKLPIVILSLQLMCTGICFAQGTGNNIILYSVNESNGLSDDHVQCVLKDKTGTVWIGTADGLNEMDGSTITVFKNSKNNNRSLIHNNVLCLAEDSAGNIWIGTANGLSFYDKQKKTFDSWVPEPSPYGSSNYLYGIVIDHHHNIWCGTHGGLLLFDVRKKSFHPFYNTTEEKKNSVLYPNRINHMIPDMQGNQLWISTADGIWTFSLDLFRFRKEISMDNDPHYQPLFTYVCQSHDGKIWAGNWGEGLVELDPVSGKVFHYPAPTPKGYVVRCINEVKQGDGKYVLWLDGRLAAFDPSTHRIFNYTKLPKESETAFTYPCYQSADGWVWLASASGLYIYNPQHQFFQHHIFSQPITSQATVFTEYENALVVGGQADHFIQAYDSGWNKIKQYLKLNENLKRSIASKANTATLSLINQQNKMLWDANSEGILKFNTATGTHRWFKHKDGDSSSLPRDFITHIYFDSHHTMWVFPWREGIWTMDTLSGICTKRWSGFQQENGKIKKLVIAYTAEDDYGNLWMSDIDEGIVLFDRKSGQFSKPFAKAIGEYVRTANIYFRNGFLYSTTTYAVLKWDQNNRKIHFYYLPAEMNKEIYDMQPDQQGNWWIVTRNGLVVFNESTQAFKRFTTADGLLNNDMDGTLFCQSNGTMLFGTQNCITSFKPKQILSAIAEVPLAQLKEISVNENPVEWNGNTTALHFDYQAKNIIFKWALPDFSNPLHNQYYCKLKGIDENWHYTGNRGEIQYAHLHSGKYTLLLKSTSANGVVSANILSIPFEITPPVWKTWWFLALTVLISAIIFFIIVRYISQRNLKEQLLQLEKEQAIDKERNRISRDMHDDLGSGLTKIAIMSEVVKKHINDPQKAKLQLESISEFSRELVDNLQDIIWILNPKNDTLESLSAYIREYALKFFEPFGTELTFSFPEILPEIKFSKETRRNIFLTVKEAFHNISKHAWCNKVEVSIVHRDKTIVINITDDGIGFDMGKIRKFSNGLTNMRNRLEQVGGRFELISEPGKGTSTILSVSA